MRHLSARRSQNTNSDIMVSAEEFIEWRIHTYEVLGLKCDQQPAIFQAYAHEFFAKNISILKSPSETGLKELAGLYQKFASLAQQLWMLKTCIIVEGLEQPSLNRFSDRDMKAHDLFRNAIGSGMMKLNGQPVQALVRPRIVSRPLRHKGVIWSQAVVWPHAIDRK